MTLAGRVALVTGSSRGIGRAIALGLAEDGADVAVNYRRDADSAGATVDAIRALGRNARAYRAPVEDREALRAMVESASAELGPIDLMALVDAVVADAMVAMPGRDVEVAMPSNVPPLHGDAGKLKQVLINLVSNGLKYSPGGGVVRVSARVDTTAGEIVFDVSDEGVGIAERDRDRLFTTFYRIRTNETEGIRGSGLGLFISRYLLSLMAGRIWFESTPQLGSTFSFSIPIDLTDVAAGADGPPSSFAAAA